VVLHQVLNEVFAKITFAANLKLRSEFEICAGNFRQMAPNRA